MGYDLHITRAEFWAQNAGKEISAEEWLRLVEDDPELIIDTDNGPHFAVSNEPSQNDAGWPRWFDWFEGNVYTKNPDRQTLGKLLQIANALDATVQGDDGETYTSVDDLHEPGDVGDTVPARRSWVRENLEYVVVAIAVLAWILFDLFW
ncbi:MAG: hypothetical protein QNJ07_12670 [Woeseiaceae bacterium]|nr:hypothetical protein [Woeseiaceae bacterium]